MAKGNALRVRLWLTCRIGRRPALRPFSFRSEPLEPRRLLSASPQAGVDSDFGFPGRLYSTGGAPDSATASDLDGDGDADLTVANAFDDSVSVFRNNGDGTF